MAVHRAPASRGTSFRDAAVRACAGAPVSAGRDRLLLEDVRFYGHHGVSKAEQAVGVWFSVDAELAVDLAPAATSDDLGAAVDYGAVARCIVAVGTGERVNLLERLAGRIAQALLREFPAQQVRVRVRKLAPPMEGLVGTPAVELTRTR